MARPEIAQLVKSGAELGLGLLQEKRMSDIFGMQKEQQMVERDAAGAINEVFQQEAQIAQRRGAGAKTLGDLRKLAAMDPAVRKTQAPVVFQALEEATGTPLAENLKQFILSAKPEVAGPVMDRIIRGYAQDPNQTLDNLLPVLTSPLASAETIGQISRELGDVASREAITGPTPSPRRDKFLQARVSRERQIAGLEKVVARYGDTKAGQIAQQKIEQLRGELEKMETIISGQDAVREGVRPGTVLTETGTGNISVLQGPAESGEGAGGPGGLKATDERFLKQLAASEFDTEINLQTGEIMFKNRAEAALANQITAEATRIFADAGGKLTLSEAYQQAKRKQGGAAPSGSNPYDAFDQGM